MDYSSCLAGYIYRNGVNTRTGSVMSEFECDNCGYDRCSKELISEGVYALICAWCLHEVEIKIK